MKKNIILWLLAFLITIATAIYQRITGPTYPISDTVQLTEKVISYKLARTHSGVSDHAIIINVGDSSITGTVYYKRYKTSDYWTPLELKYDNGNLKTLLPYQPPAGKLEYYVELNYKDENKRFPSDQNVVIRFKGNVPMWVLIPHILAMFGAMMLSNRTGLEFFNKGKNIKKLTYWTLSFLVIGGFILGPIMQKYAFGEFWTGFPFGYDLTDNKTLIAIVGWVITLYMYTKSKSPKNWALFGASLLLVVYLIPHSVMGSELDYNKIDAEKNKTEKVLKE